MLAFCRAEYLGRSQRYGKSERAKANVLAFCRAGVSRAKDASPLTDADTQIPRLARLLIFPYFCRLFSKTMKKLIVLLLLNICTVGMAMSQIVADSVQILFQPGSSRISPISNGRALQAFTDKVRRCADNGNLDRVLVRAYTSPDGVSTANLRLSADRCQSVADYIVSNAGVDPDLIDSDPCGIAWDRLRRLIASDHHVPGRREVLDIIDYTPVWVVDTHGNVSGSRKQRIMELKGGQTFCHRG